jgi:hypothetical protein
MLSISTTGIGGFSGLREIVAGGAARRVDLLRNGRLVTVCKLEAFPSETRVIGLLSWELSAVGLKSFMWLWRVALDCLFAPDTPACCETFSFGGSILEEPRRANFDPLKEGDGKRVTVAFEYVRGFVSLFCWSPDFLSSLNGIRTE